MTHYTYLDMKDVIDYGSDYNKNLRMVLAYLDPDHTDSYDNWEDMDQAISTDARCVCKMEIVHVHGVRHTITGNTLDIGSSCIGKFSPQMKKDANRRVYRLHHPDNVYCAHCDKTVSKTGVEKYDGMENHYHSKCLKETFQKCPGCKLFDGYDCQCVDVQCCMKGCKTMIRTMIGHGCNHRNDNIRAEREKAQSFVMKYGKYKGRSIDQMMNDKRELQYLTWMFKTTESDCMKGIIRSALKQELEPEPPRR
jgi:hypothetical protein